MLGAGDQAIHIFWVRATERLIKFSLVDHKINHFLMSGQSLSEPSFTQDIHQQFELISSHVLKNKTQN